MVTQPTLWDNQEFEEGKKYLNTLQLAKARVSFEKSRINPYVDSLITNHLIEDCSHWEELIEKSYPSMPAEERFQAIWKDFKEYRFLPGEREFRKALLQKVHSLSTWSGKLSAGDAAELCDELNKTKLSALARDTASTMLHKMPQNIQFNYIYAESLWRNGEKQDANRVYASALLKWPSGVIKNRIRNSNIIKMVEKYGAEMAPAYAWFEKVLPYVKLADDIVAESKPHETALKCYRLLNGLYKSAIDKQNQKNIELRKELKMLSPELFNGYIRWQQSNRSW